MWNTTYAYPIPVATTANGGMIPTILVSMFESSTSEVEVSTSPPPSKSTSKSKNKTKHTTHQTDREGATTQRHKHHTSRQQYYVHSPDHSPALRPSGFLPILQYSPSSSSLGGTTRNAHLILPIFFPGSADANANVNSPDQLLVRPLRPSPSAPALKSPVKTPTKAPTTAPTTMPSKAPTKAPTKAPPARAPTAKPRRPEVEPSPALVAGPSAAAVDRAIGGKKRALCIGINYVGQDRMLRGCANDAKRVRKFLIEHHDFPRDDVVILSDSGGSHGIPTRKNILNSMRWLVRDAKKGDSLFFHYSGHGGQVPDLNGDEIDGMDEVIFPVDFKQHGFIVDDDMHAIMVKDLPEGCRLTALFDSCHSGTALDLPYIYSPSGRPKHGRLSKREVIIKSRANAVSWSACEDGQTSKDTFSMDGSAGGAMSNAFVNILKQTPKLTYKELLKYLRVRLEAKDNQKPQLSSSDKIDINDLFII